MTRRPWSIGSQLAGRVLGNGGTGSLYASFGLPASRATLSCLSYGWKLVTGDWEAYQGVVDAPQFSQRKGYAT